jgi:glycosyltransferase involved in cell wall biosynthesis
MRTDPPPSVLLPLPQGLGVSGVVTWAVDLANALAARGWRVGVALHPEPEGYRRIQTQFHPSVRVTDLRALPAYGTTGPDLSPFVRAYRAALEDLGWSSASPCVLLPSLDADCYAAAALLAGVHADRMRVVGWQHSDTAFDTALMRTYEPMLARIVGVSDHITGTLRATIPTRAADVVQVPYGVPVPDRAPADRARDEPLRLIYVGRLEHEQKRAGVLPRLARLLSDRNVRCSMTIVGDGPAAAEIDAAIAGIDLARRLPGCGREQVRTLLAESDALILPSRYEGLSLSMLEAMANGAAPVVARVRSGATEAIHHGVSGLLVEAPPEADPDAVAHAFAGAIAPLACDRTGVDQLRRAAYAAARERFDHRVHTDRCEALFRSVLMEPPRPWPADRPARFGGSGAPAGHGSVPADAESRARAALERFAHDHPDARLGVYGLGRHTLALAAPLAEHAGRVDCVVDDDPARHGSALWGWPIVGPGDLASRGVRHALVSSWMHQSAMADRCRALGVEPLTLYPVTR